MAFKREEGYNISETGNWNVASDYARLKIMKPLYLCDVYENIARFGYDSMLQQLSNLDVPLDSLKLSGFERLVNELIRLCNNVMFAMGAKGTRETLKKYEENLVKIRKIIPTLSRTISKQKVKIIQIIPERYYRVLDTVLAIKANMNDPLNKNHLIFTSKEEFDPRAFKQMVKEDALLRG